MPGYKKEQEDRRLLAFSASPAQDLGAFEMSSLSEVTGSFLLLSPRRPAADGPKPGEQMWFATRLALQCLGKAGGEKGDFAAFYKAGFILSVNQ